MAIIVYTQCLLIDSAVLAHIFFDDAFTPYVEEGVDHYTVNDYVKLLIKTVPEAVRSVFTIQYLL